MKTSSSTVRLPSRDDDSIAPVTILDAEGRVVRVVPATEFRRPGQAARGHWRERRRRPPRSKAGGTGPED